MPTDLNLWRTPQHQNSVTGQGAKFDLYKQVPCFTWVGEWINTSTVQGHLQNFVNQAAGKTIGVVVYGFPRYGYSAGGYNTMPEYQAWVNNLTTGLGQGRAIVVLEPDALSSTDNMQDGTTPQQAIAYAVTRVRATCPNARVYIDAGNSQFGGTDSEVGAKLRNANVANAHGFASNVSNFFTNAVEVTRCEGILANLVANGVTGKQYVIDTSRNGNGPLTSTFGPDATPWINANAVWLNPPGRALGTYPCGAPDPAYPNWYAAVWVKDPGGSDGQDPGLIGAGAPYTFFSNYFGQNAPSAGQFFLNWVIDALKTTPESRLTFTSTTPTDPTPSTTYAVADDFNLDQISTPPAGSVAVADDFNLPVPVVAPTFPRRMKIWSGIAYRAVAVRTWNGSAWVEREVKPPA